MILLLCGCSSGSGVVGEGEIVEIEFTILMIIASVARDLQVL